MSDDLDPRLMARFTAARNARLDEAFLTNCLAKLEHERRRRVQRLAAAGGAGLLLLAWKMPLLLDVTAHLADRMVSTLAGPAAHAGSATPEGSAAAWGISLLVGALVLWRTPSVRHRR